MIQTYAIKNTIKGLEYPQTGFTAALCDENRKQTKAAKIHEPECPAAPPEEVEQIVEITPAGYRTLYRAQGS